jgi:tRNA(His) 5'-end guanylyltransferase
MATLAFNRYFNTYIHMMENVLVNGNEHDIEVLKELGVYEYDLGNFSLQSILYRKALNKGACFDSRCFNIPKEEVTNYFYWRQIDATRNSIEMIGHANFSTKELHKKSCSQIQDMLHEQKGINWNDFSVPEKRGTCCVKQSKEVTTSKGETSIRSEWIIDTNIPIFKGEDREYIESRFVGIEED